MREFVYTGAPSRVVFGAGAITQLPQEIERLGLRRVMVLSTPHQAGAAHETVANLGKIAAGVFGEAAMHTPVEVTERALLAVAQLRADGLLAVGGGSTTGLAKAIALRTDLPQIIAPTTYAGSEMTPILGETRQGVKTTRQSPKVLPETVIYDVDLTLGLPSRLSVTSGLNAVAHAVEALYARERNPLTSLMAEEGVRVFARALPAICRDPADREARSEALYGAWLCGMCLGAVGMALHHKLCHTLGGAFDLPHSETHAVVLPHALAYNAPAAPEAMARLSRALDAADPVASLHRLAVQIGAPVALKDLGMPREEITRAVQLSLANPYWNPRSLELDGVTRLIEDAWIGAPPRLWVG